MNELAPPPSSAMYIEVNAQRYALNLEQIYMLGAGTSDEKLSHEHIINVDEEDVDVKHCIVSVSAVEGVFICDMLTKSGTYLNGTLVTPLKKTIVHHGDILRLGRTASIKFINEQMETSHDSSGFGETNKNTSEIICSSPESSTLMTSRDSHKLKSQNDGNMFLVPATPNRLLNITVEKKFENSQNETSPTRRLSLSLNSSNNQSRRSDSFCIPETQYCNPRTSTESNRSWEDSCVEKGEEEDDDDYCVPETQDVLSTNQIPRNPQDSFTTALNTLNEKSVDLKDSDDDDSHGSQFRICTQEYNEGFGEEEEDESVLHSQVIPFIKHTAILVNTSGEIQTTLQNIKDKGSHGGGSVQEEDKELTNIDWAASSTTQKASTLANNINSNCSTPDLFEFEAFDKNYDNNHKTKVSDNDNKGDLFEDSVSNAPEDDEDFMVTQAFPSKNANHKRSESKIQSAVPVLGNKDDRPMLNSNDKHNAVANSVTDEEDLIATQAFLSRSINTKLSDKNEMQLEEDILSGKEDEPFLTLSDKENLHPVSADSSLASTSRHRSGLNQTEPKATSISSDTVPVQLIGKESNNKDLSMATDEEDDILTQAFPHPTKSPNMSALVNNNCLHSTLLDQKAINKNPASFFDEMEDNGKIVQPLATPENVFKMPGRFNAKVSKSPPGSIDTDLDLLMCTPQLIKDHLHFSQTDDLRKTILAAKNKSLLEDETDDAQDTEDDPNSEDKCLVQLTNAPKDSKDFDKLLPHLKMEERKLKDRKILTDKQKAVKEASKKYKFNLSFGQEQDKLKRIITYSRDDRHLKRDQEREMAEKNSNVSEGIKHGKVLKRVSTRTRLREVEKSDEATEVVKEERKIGEKDTRVKQKKADPNTKNNTDEVDGKNTTKKQNDKNDKKKIKNLNTLEEGSEDKMEVAKNEPKEAKQNTKDKQKSASNRKEKNSSKSQKDGEEDTIQKFKISEKDKDHKIENTKNKQKDAEQNTKGSKEEQVPLSKNKAKINSQEKQIENLVASEKAIKDEVEVIKSKPKEAERKTKSSKNAQESTSKSKTNISSEKREISNDVKEMQPRRRSTRSMSRSTFKNENDDQSDKLPTTSSAASTSSTESRLRSRTVSNKSNSAVVSKSAANDNMSNNKTDIKPERKRKSQVTEQPLVEEKRPKRTISQDSKASPSKPTSVTPPKYLISTTMVDQGKLKELARIANGLWAVVKDPLDSNILVMDKAFRTYKFLLAIARGIPIVTSQWLQKLTETKSLRKAPIEEFLFHDPVFEKTHKFSLVKSLQMVKENKGLFKGYSFLLTSKIQPQPIEIKTIIESSGGKVLTKVPPAPQEDQKLYLVSSIDERKEWHKFRRINNKIIIVSTESIMSSVMRQTTAALANHELS